MIIINWNVSTQVARCTMCQLKAYVYNDLGCHNNGKDLYLGNYGTNHPQLKRHTCVPRVQKQKTRGIKPLVSTRVCTHLHASKMNAPHTRTYPYEVSATKRSSLQPVVP